MSIYRILDWTLWISRVVFLCKNPDIYEGCRENTKTFKKNHLSLALFLLVKISIWGVGKVKMELTIVCSYLYSWFISSLYHFANLIIFNSSQSGLVQITRFTCNFFGLSDSGSFVVLWQWNLLLHLLWVLLLVLWFQPLKQLWQSDPHLWQFLLYLEAIMSMQRIHQLSFVGFLIFL